MYLELAKLQSLKNTSLTFNKQLQFIFNNCNFEGFIKPPSGLIIFYEDSQNSLKAIIFMVTIYYR